VVDNKKTTRKKKMKRVVKTARKIKKKETNQMDKKQLLKTKTMKSVILYSLTLKWMMSVKLSKNFCKFVKSVVIIWKLI
jgi:hypothetical protein